MRSLWRFVKFLTGLMVLIGIGVAAAFYAGVELRTSPVTAEVDIRPGASVAEIGRTLAHSGVIVTPRLFSLWVRVAGLDAKLKAGTYEFEAGMTLRAVAAKIVRGEVKSFPLTIIEGWTINDIAAALAQQPFVAGTEIVEQFKTLTHDPEFIARLGFTGIASLEGYLFPDTYQITRPRSAEDIIVQLVARFRQVYTSDDAARAAELGLSQHQVITLASIIEKETGKAEERPIIAAVFLHRLKIGMVLASDPTVIYGLPHFDGNLHKEDLSNPHPYNTYVHAGLPPGPIANPSRASIEATLHPAAVDDLYFVSRGDGSHEFTKTLAEHLRAVMRYQLQR